MPALPSPALLVAVLGVVLIAGGVVAVRASGARTGMARRLAGAREVAVGTLHDLGFADEVAARPVRVAGRIRCAEPLVTPQGDRLVAFHRDVDVAMPDGRWRNIERLRETRSFELWDHNGWLEIDPAAAAEPLVVLPRVWEGDTAELDEGHRPAVQRLLGSDAAPSRARATTWMVSVTDRLLVLAEVRTSQLGGPLLAPPAGGYIISALELDAAMRVLGGPGRNGLVIGAVAVVLGIAALMLGLGIGLVGIFGGG